MANKRKKKKYKTKNRLHNGGRNWLALAVHFATGAGAHQDCRTKRKRTRNAEERAAIEDHS